MHFPFFFFVGLEGGPVNAPWIISRKFFPLPLENEIKIKKGKYILDLTL